MNDEQVWGTIHFSLCFFFIYIHVLTKKARLFLIFKIIITGRQRQAVLYLNIISYSD